MNGEIPKFLEKESLPKNYFDAPNPYAPLPERDVNLLELSRYAKSNKKKLVDLTTEEVEKFKLRK